MEKITQQDAYTRTIESERTIKHADLIVILVVVCKEASLLSPPTTIHLHNQSLSSTF